MNKKDFLISLLGGLLLVVVVNCTDAGEYLDGYEYPEEPVTEPAPDLTVEVCKPLGEVQAREQYFERVFYFLHEVAIEQVLEEQRLDYLKAEQDLKTNVDVY